MKVLHVFGSMDVGGAELRTLDLMRQIAAEGFEFHFAVLSGREGVLADELRSLGGTIHRTPLGPRFPLGFVRVLRHERPAAVDSHVATFSGAILLLAWLARVPTRIAHFRSDGDGHPDTVRRRLQRAVMRALIRLFATDIVGVSPSSLTDGYRADWAHDRRARVVPNGVSTAPRPPADPPLRRAAAVPDDAPAVLHVGRPSPEKNRPRAVEVVHALRARGTAAHLVLVGGEGTDAARLAATVARLGASPYVHDVGMRPDAVSLMAEADVVILTSDREGLPGVVLEALSVGTPVVATALPGVQYIADLLPGVRAVPQDAAMDTWCDAIDAALEESAAPGRRASIREEFAAGPFSLDGALEAHRALYRGALRG